MSLPLSACPAAKTSPAAARLEQPALRRVAGAPEIGGVARPVQVHVDRERRRRGVVAEPPLLLRDARERQACPSELGRNGDAKISGLAKLVEVVREERVVAIVLRRPLREPGEHLVGQNSLCRRR